MMLSSFLADDATLSQFDTLVVNAGAHLRSGALEAYGSMMKSASESLTSAMRRLHGDNAILVVRNIVPGHGQSFDRWETFQEGDVGYSLPRRLKATLRDGFGGHVNLRRRYLFFEVFHAVQVA